MTSVCFKSARMIVLPAVIGLLAACEPEGVTPYDAPTPPPLPADYGQDMIDPASPGPAPELVPIPLESDLVDKPYEEMTFADVSGPKAPSFGEPCPDDGPRLPMTGVCQGRAINYIDPATTLITEAPEGCDWVMTDADFGPDALLFRALSCNGVTTQLEFGAGAHAAEMTYFASPLEREKGQVVIRVATAWEDDDWRLRETIPEEALDQCAIQLAGEGYPEGARIIAPAASHPGADCGAYALSETSDNFWINADEFVFAFTLPPGQRDIDPATVIVLTPQ